MHWIVPAPSLSNFDSKEQVDWVLLLFQTTKKYLEIIESPGNCKTFMITARTNFSSVKTAGYFIVMLTDTKKCGRQVSDEIILKYRLVHWKTCLAKRQNFKKVHYCTFKHFFKTHCAGQRRALWRWCRGWRPWRWPGAPPWSPGPSSAQTSGRSTG